MGSSLPRDAPLGQQKATEAPDAPHLVAVPVRVTARQSLLSRVAHRPAGRGSSVTVSDLPRLTRAASHGYHRDRGHKAAGHGLI